MFHQKDCNNCCSLFLRNLPHGFCVNSHSSESGHIGCAMKLGEKIKPVRIHRGLSQRELGERLRLDGNVANRIAQYESGFRTPKESKNKETANALNVSGRSCGMC
ncbi:helix-turn-helix domain-containing protein [Gemmiger formicilis]|uniref:helix-turn-helix domain-containing protein n=2 Tax=Gemmiger formicilis TaxID=745368 RepID=UPI003A523046